MSIRLVFKELRETAWIAGIALVVNLAFAIGFTGVLRGREPFWKYLWTLKFTDVLRSGSPFWESPFTIAATVDFVIVGMCLAAALGLRQTVGDRAQQTFRFLLHRPPGLRWSIGTKLLVGVGLYLIVALVPLAFCVWWAATPGTHPSPFRWAMTRLAWQGWLAGSILYLGAFLAGLCPARWFGTRLLLLIGAAGLAGFFTFFSWSWTVGMLLTLLADLLLAGCIVFVARTRDFS